MDGFLELSKVSLPGRGGLGWALRIGHSFSKRIQHRSRHCTGQPGKSFHVSIKAHDQLLHCPALRRRRVTMVKDIACFHGTKGTFVKGQPGREPVIIRARRTSKNLNYYVASLWPDPYKLISCSSVHTPIWHPRLVFKDRINISAVYIRVRPDSPHNSRP